MSGAHANLLLLVAALFWGFGNVAQKTVLEHLDPFSAVGLRCLIGGLLILPLMRLDRDGVPTPGYWLSALRVAAIFALALLMSLGYALRNPAFAAILLGKKLEVTS